MIDRIEGEYDEWVSITDISKDAEIDDSVQILYVDTRDFALGWNFEQPNYYENAACGSEYKTNNGLELINYSTRIAYHQNNKLYINISKYSRTTSKIQSQLKELASGFEIVEYEGE